MVQAHPFRARGYNHAITLSPSITDGAEGFNAANEMPWNTLALRYAQVMGLPVTAGSDNHCADTMTAEKLAGVTFDRPLRSIRDYVRAIVEKRPFGLHLPVQPPVWTESVTPDLPTTWLDENGSPVARDTIRVLKSGL